MTDIRGFVTSSVLMLMTAATGFSGDLPFAEQSEGPTENLTATYDAEFKAVLTDDADLWMDVDPADEPDGWSDGESSLAPTYYKIPGVPFQSQLATGCTKNNWCCGLAATNMGTSYQWGATPTATVLANMYKYLGKNACCTGGTNSYDQRLVAQKVASCARSTAPRLTYASLKTSIAARYPVVVALKYSYISSKCASFSGNHSVLVVGYDEPKALWYVHDPLCSSSSTGSYRAVPSVEFRAGVDDYARQVGYSDKNSVFSMIPKR